MFSLPIASKPQPYSQQTSEKSSRLRGATVTESVCPYCAVGCGQLIWVHLPCLHSACRRKS